MPDEAPGPTQTRWCDVDGSHISLLGRADRRAPGTQGAVSRLHECGEVLGRGPDVLYVRFAGAGLLLSVAPALGRLLPEAPGGD
jgi:hypothetical protein